MTIQGHTEIEYQINSDTFIVSEKIWGFLKKKENIVADTSVLIKWFFSSNEENTEAAHCMLNRFLNNEIGIIAPEIALFELANVIKNKFRAENNGAIGREIIDRVYNLGIIFKVTKQILKAAFDLALDIDESVYDCMFIATAGHFNSKFVTDDQKLYLSYKNFIETTKTGEPNCTNKTIDIVLLKEYLK